MIEFFLGMFLILLGTWLIYDTYKNKEEGVLGSNFDVGYFAKGALALIFGIALIIIKLFKSFS